MLAAAIGGLNLIERRLKKGDPDPEMLFKYVAASMDGATRALDLTQRLLEFGREPPLFLQSMDCNALIMNLAEQIRSMCGSKIQLNLPSNVHLEKAMADTIRTNQALLNLVSNAVEAMPDGGELTVKVATVEVKGDIALTLEIEPGTYVVFSVHDTGIGMEPETLSHAIEPLFTTRDAGKGFGLGLTEAFRYARRAGGGLRLRSEVGRGTLVEMFLPAVDRICKPKPGDHQATGLS